MINHEVQKHKVTHCDVGTMNHNFSELLWTNILKAFLNAPKLMIVYNKDQMLKNYKNAADYTVDEQSNTITVDGYILNIIGTAENFELEDDSLPICTNDIIANVNILPEYQKMFPKIEICNWVADCDGEEVHSILWLEVF